MHWTKPATGLAVLLVGALAASASVLFLRGAEMTALGATALVAAAVAAFVALGWTEKHSTPYW